MYALVTINGDFQLLTIIPSLSVCVDYHHLFLPFFLSFFMSDTLRFTDQHGNLQCFCSRLNYQSISKLNLSISFDGYILMSISLLQTMKILNDRDSLISSISASKY
jgi:hypothetical protein